MQKRLSREEYRDEVQACAERIQRKDRASCVRQCAELHPWVLDLGMNLEVLRITTHDNAYFSEYGPMLALSFADAVYKMAFAAFHADVAEALASLEAGT